MEELGILRQFPELAIGLLIVLYGFSYELSSWSVRD